VADDGSINWMRDYWPESAPPVTEPDFCDRIADPQKVAAAVVTTITRAMSQATLAPAGMGQAPSGRRHGGRSSKI
jgi:hypothetical protein